VLLALRDRHSACAAFRHRGAFEKLARTMVAFPCLQYPPLHTLDRHDDQVSLDEVERILI